MVSDQENILQWFYRQSYSDNCFDFSSLLLDAAILALNKDPFSAQSIATSKLNRYWNALRKKADSDRFHERSPVFEIVDIQLKKAKWYPESLVASGNGERGQYLKARPLILQIIDSLSDRQYEALGCLVSEMLGAAKTHLTPPGNEGGVDFFAFIQIPIISHIFGSIHKGMRIVGQTKKYDSRESITKFNSFLVSLDNIRHVHRSVANHMPAWFRRGRGPIVGWYIAHQGAQRGVLDTAQEHGIVVSDSIDLAEVAALSNKLDRKKSPQERASLLLPLINRIISS